MYTRYPSSLARGAEMAGPLLSAAGYPKVGVPLQLAGNMARAMDGNMLSAAAFATTALGVMKGSRNLMIAGGVLSIAASLLPDKHLSQPAQASLWTRNEAALSYGR